MCAIFLWYVSVWAQTLVLRRSDLVGEIFFTYMSGQTIKRKCTVLATTLYELGFAVAHALDWRRLNHGSCTMSYMLKLSFHLGSILTHAFETWWDFLSNKISILNQSIKRLTLKLDFEKDGFSLPATYISTELRLLLGNVEMLELSLDVGLCKLFMLTWVKR